MSSNESNPTKDREAQFLASQKARLSKLHQAQEANPSTDVHAQARRKEFWQQFKLESSSLQQRLSALVGEGHDITPTDITEQTHTNAAAGGNMKKSLLFVTAQQRNEALEKLQNLQLSIRAINHYTLRSTKFSQEIVQFLPQFFAQNEMPELPTADLRLLNDEVQLLKKRTQQVQQIIMPKEKFRFKRYHAFMLEQKQLKGPIFEEDEDDVTDETAAGRQEEKNEKGSANNATFDFDGLALTNRSSSTIIVENDGSIEIKTNAPQGDTTERVPPRTTCSVLEAKAFLIRNIDDCKIRVHGMYNSVHVINSNNSTIQIASPIHGPVHVTNCKDTIIQIPFSRQLRIHDCTNVTFVIHVASGPIIEGCKGMQFFQRDCSNALGSDQFDPGTNLYWDVKDFHWLKNNVKSPNFDVCTEAELEKDSEVSAIVASFEAVLVQDEHDRDEDNSAENTITKIMESDISDEESSEDEL